MASIVPDKGRYLKILGADFVASSVACKPLIRGFDPREGEKIGP